MMKKILFIFYCAVLLSGVICEFDIRLDILSILPYRKIVKYFFISMHVIGLLGIVILSSIDFFGKKKLNPLISFFTTAISILLLAVYWLAYSIFRGYAGVPIG